MIMSVQPSIVPTVEQQELQARQVLLSRAKNGANWFFWIAGFSLLNTIIYAAGSTIAFIIGLGATQFVDGFIGALIDEIGPNSTTVLTLFAFAINIGIAGIFIVAGLLGRKNYRWAMIVGMVLYVLDAIIFIWAGDPLSVVFHALALWGLWTGLKAMNGLKKLSAASSTVLSPAPLTQELSLFHSDIFRIFAGSCGVYLAILLVMAIIGFILVKL
jgi:hypothetical protein